MQKILILVLVILSLSQQTQITKGCQHSIENIQKRTAILTESFEKQDFDDVVAETLVLDNFLSYLQEDCPVIYEKKEVELFSGPTDCQKNIHRFQELVQGDIVSNFQDLKDINDFLSTSCLPMDYMHNGFSEVIKENQNSQKVKLGSQPKTQCVTCNVLVSAIGLYIQTNNPDLHEFLHHKQMCKLFPGGLLRNYCYIQMELHSAQLIKGFEAGENSDVICRDRLKTCADWPQCNLHGQSTPQPPKLELELEQEEEQDSLYHHPLVRASLPPWLRKLIDKLTSEHLPIRDLDGDRFSTKATLRGWDWRGKDCSPYNKNVYPGRKKFVGLKGSDHNCNGIHGYDHATGVPYKDQYCQNSKQMGSITIGDSAGAHFSLPPQYLNGSQWNSDTFNSFYHNLENEFDVPNESSGTGFEQSMKGHSFYLKLLERNRCNRNDYQNLAVNGASSRNSMKNMLAIARRQQKDYPALIFWELIGNDVCGKTPTSMTEPAEFKQNIIELWAKLDTILPRGSHMVVTGVADGRILYDCLHNRMHPLGVTYVQFYNFMNCMNTSPCSGWMNSDEAIRNQTTARAVELNEQYKEIIRTHKYKNFDIQYYDMPMKEIFQTIEDRGGQCWNGIEPSDGFHPSELSDQLWADILWSNLERDHPDWLGPINPHNQDIIDQFGNGLHVDHIIEDLEEIELQ